MMSKFRFKAEHFEGPEHFVKEGKLIISGQSYADQANRILEAEEKKCERVYADCRPVHRNWCDELEYPQIVRGKFTITALLWNVEKIDG